MTPVGGLITNPVQHLIQSASVLPGSFVLLAKGSCPCPSAPVWHICGCAGEWSQLATFPGSPLTWPLALALEGLLAPW